NPGEQVEAGSSMCVLSDHCRLYLQGKAFEADAPQLIEATEKNQPVTVARLAEGRDDVTEEQLLILYLSDSIDPDSRAFHFYMELPNVITQDRNREGNRFIDWKYKPGQRFEVRLPVGKVSKQLVLPIGAVVREGAEAYVFRQNGKYFERVPVHVEYQGPQQVVIANDGALFPGDVVAAQGAYQMYLAIKNKATGGVDPHAGHNH
ncbi:MAG: efflux RND transporter periplasmic adaptor subunit, partial [Pirellulales bacterium]|nr:efflux RND transporter periplasmic adaptor subunit [Pirellulales bacterium]